MRVPLPHLLLFACKQVPWNHSIDASGYKLFVCAFHFLDPTRLITAPTRSRRSILLSSTGAPQRNLTKQILSQAWIIQCRRRILWFTVIIGGPEMAHCLIYISNRGMEAFSCKKPLMGGVGGKSIPSAGAKFLLVCPLTRMLIALHGEIRIQWKTNGGWVVYRPLQVGKRRSVQK